MILCKCHIINFGCLSDLNIEFKEGLNEQLLPNGSGKSTFAAFLCSMFYGLDSNNKKDLASNSRRHYTPWNQGIFGGSVDFLYHGTPYHMERTFAAKEKEDSYALYNLNTMEFSSDLPVNPGPQIFGIDKDGFMKTLYIPQLKPAIEPNSSLSSRLISLTYAADDISQYDHAVKALDKASRSYVKTGNRGSIAEASAKLSELERQLTETLAANQRYQELEEEIHSKNAGSRLIKESLKELDERILSTTKRQTLTLCQNHLRTIKEYENQLEQSGCFFKDQIPDLLEISEKIAICRSLSMEESLYHDKKLTDFEARDQVFLETLFSEDYTEEASADIPSFSESQLRLLSRNVTYQNQALLFLSDLKERSSQEENCDQNQTNPVPLKVLTNLENRLLLLKKKKDSLDNHKQRISFLKEQRKLTEEKRTAAKKPEAKQDFRSEYSVDDLNHYLIVAATVTFFSLLLLLGHHPAIAFFLFFLFVAASAGYVYLKLSVSQKNYDYQLKLYEEGQKNLISEEEEITAKLDMLSYESDSLKSGIQSLTEEISDIIKNWHILDNAMDDTSDYNRFDNPDDDNRYDNPDDADTIADLIILSDEFLSRLNYLRHASSNAEKRSRQLRSMENSHKQFYLALKTKLEQYQGRKEIESISKSRISHLQDELKDYLCLYYPDVMKLSDTEAFQSVAYREKLQDLKLRLGQYQQILEFLKKARLQYQDFLKEHPELPLLSNGEPDFSELLTENILTENLSTLRSKQEELNARYEEEQKELGTLQNQKSMLAARMEEYSALEEKKNLLSARIKKAQEHVKLLKLTASYLEQAKANYAKAYLKSIERHIKEFSNVFSCDLLNKISFTQDFSLQINDQGLLRSSDWYSQGTQDLFAFCCRLAFIEDLYPEEKPFLILDDSFVNLDEASIEKVRILIEDLSSKYQIIYFTCHSSRSLISPLEVEKS